MQKSNIEWCDSTWNPVTGCKHGCEYCYARRIARRFGGASETHCNETVGTECQWATEADGGEHILDNPIFDCDRGHNAPFPFEFDPTFHRYRLGEAQRARKPQTIFVCSMADLFGAWVPTRWIVEVLDACEAAPQHRYMFLTKNPERYAQLDRLALLPRRDNFWYGTTVTNTHDVMYRLPFRINTFLSIEPLHEYLNAGIGSFGRNRLIIIGAETGNRAGKITPEKAWVDNICEAADLTQAAVFMKDSLRPIVGKANMRRELPWEKGEQQA